MSKLGEILEDLCHNTMGNPPYRIDQAHSQILDLMLSEEFIDTENICEKVHQAYCKYHLENKGTEYWTKGNYALLSEEGKEYDRRTVRAVLKAIHEAMRRKVE